jgi:hypothetical protein
MLRLHSLVAAAPLAAALRCPAKGAKAGSVRLTAGASLQSRDPFAGTLRPRQSRIVLVPSLFAAAVLTYQ